MRDIDEYSNLYGFDWIIGLLCSKFSAVNKSGAQYETCYCYNKDAASKFGVTIAIRHPIEIFSKLFEAFFFCFLFYQIIRVKRNENIKP